MGATRACCCSTIPFHVPRSAGGANFCGSLPPTLRCVLHAPPAASPRSERASRRSRVVVSESGGSSSSSRQRSRVGMPSATSSSAGADQAGRGGAFRARPVSRGLYAPFKLEESSFQPTRSVSPMALRRSRAAKKATHAGDDLAPPPPPSFRARPLPTFVKRRASSSSAAAATTLSKENIGRQGGDANRRRSDGSAKTLNATVPAPFHLRCDAMMASRKAAASERMARRQQAEQERLKQERDERKAKEAELLDDLDRNMFKARPVPKFMACRTPAK